LELSDLVRIFIVISQNKMKVLRILLIVLLPAVGLVGCCKSKCKPRCETSNSSTTNPNDPSIEAEGDIVASRTAGPVVEPTENGDLVSSGDEDRDGGDKKKKK